jgi:hypothetical protein
MTNQLVRNLSKSQTPTTFSQLPRSAKSTINTATLASNSTGKANKLAGAAMILSIYSRASSAVVDISDIHLARVAGRIWK